MLVDGIILYLCFLISLSFHECAHAWMAQRCGDSTAKLLGRLTLNPLAHIDMLGTVIIPALMIFLPLLGSSAAALSGFIIGWARPVPVNPNNFRNYRREMKGLDWGALYDEFKDAVFDTDALESEIGRAHV